MIEWHSDDMVPERKPRRSDHDFTVAPGLPAGAWPG
jgi:hypothetical protein